MRIKRIYNWLGCGDDRFQVIKNDGNAIYDNTNRPVMFDTRTKAKKWIEASKERSE